MHEIRSSFRRAPWGLKRYYAPLPVLSILLLTTALAAPNILRTNFLIFQDSGTTIVVTVQQVVHMSGPTGKIVGIASVTNTRAFPIQILALSATLTRDGTPASPIMLTISVAPGKFPIDIAAGDTAKIQFSGPFSGDLTTLASGQTFTVAPDFSWSEMPPSGMVGPFLYNQAKDCTIPSTINPSPLGGQWAGVPRVHLQRHVRLPLGLSRMLHHDRIRIDAGSHPRQCLIHGNPPDIRARARLISRPS